MRKLGLFGASANGGAGTLAVAAMAAVCAVPHDAAAASNCVSTGMTMAVNPAGGPTETTCFGPGGAIALQSNAGEGGPLILSNGANIGPGASVDGYPAILSVSSNPFHIQEHQVYRTGLVPDGFGNFVPGPVLVTESFWSTGLVPYVPTYHSRPILLSNSGDITSRDEGKILIYATGSLESVTVSNEGDLKAEADYTTALRAESGVGRGFPWQGVSDQLGFAGGPVSLTNSGDVNLRGFATTGLYGRTVGGGVTITNSGDVRVNGESGTAIRADAQYGRLSIINSGEITTFGAGLDRNGSTINGNGMTAIEANVWDIGDVTVENNGKISIEGDNGVGMRVEHADEIDVSSAPEARTRITGSGDIHIDGAYATGIEMYAVHGIATLAYSGDITVDGEHGIGIAASTHSGNLTVVAKGNVAARGGGSHGILLAGIADPAEGSNVVTNVGTFTVEIAPGIIVSGGSENPLRYLQRFEQLAAGVMVLGGARTAIVNRGIVTADSGLAITAYEGPLTIIEENPDTGEEETFSVQFRAGPLSVTNYGRISGDIVTGSGADKIVNRGTGVIAGNIDLGGGVNSIFITDDAAILSLDRIALGAGNTLTNDGILSPAGTGLIKHTAIVGNFVQTANGRLVVDIDPAFNRSDFVEISGTAVLAGAVIPNFLTLPAGLEARYRILQADGGITDKGIVADPTLEVADTVGYDFGLDIAFDRTLYLTAAKRKEMSELADEAAARTSAGGTQADNLASLGGALTKIEKQRDPELRHLMTALRLAPTLEELASAMTRLTPQGQGAQASGAAGGAMSFGNAMLSCAERDGPSAFSREGQCYWGKLAASRLDRDASSNAPGVGETAMEIAGGVQVALWDQLRLGLALAYQDLDATIDDGTRKLGDSEGGRVQAGVVLKNQWGPFNAYLNLAGSWGRFDLDRHIGIAGVGGTAEAEQDVAAFVSRVRLSYLVDSGRFYAKPLVDVSATHVRLGGYQETGAGAANLDVASSSDWILGVSPGLEFGAELGSAEGTLLRPYIRAGATFLDKGEIAVATSFVAAPGAPFIIKGAIEDVYADVEAGVHVLTAQGFNLRLAYEGRFSEDVRQHGGALKITAPW